MDVLEYEPKNERDVIDLILDIQTNEFGIQINEDQQPDLKNIPNIYQKGNGNFWVSIHQNNVIGTISLLDIGNDQVALRKMFVHLGFRGKEFGISSALLRQALKYAREKSVKSVYLGTTAEFIAAHKFYEKNGFVEVSKVDLPAKFPVMAVDSKFYVYAF